MNTFAKTLCLTVLATIGSVAFIQQAFADDRKDEKTMAKVTGIGGVFFLSKGDGKALSAWYEKHLGIKIEDFGAAIITWSEDTAEDGGTTVWHVDDKDSEWFSPSQSQFMINYRVDDLELMVKQLIAAEVDILKGPEYHENGIFAWLMDPEGNKIELWEPMNWDPKNKK
ncbi:MAG: VOC family protein [Pseudomonadota bacterium]